MFKRMKLGTKLIVVLLLIGLLPMLGVSVFAFIQSNAELTQAQFEKLILFSKQKEEAVENWFSNLQSITVITAAGEEIQEGLNLLAEADGGMESEEWALQQEYIRELLAITMKEYGVDQMMVLNGDGIVVYDSAQHSVGTNASQRDYFKRAMQGRVSNSDIFYSDVIDEQCMTIAAPIYASGTSGEVSGVLISIEGIEAITEVVTNDLQVLGHSADVYMIGGDGLLYTKPRFEGLTQFESKLDTYGAQKIQEAIGANYQDFQDQDEYDDYTGEDVLGSYLIAHLGDFRAGLIAEISSSEALAAANHMRNIAIAVTGVLAVLIFLFGWRFAGSISKPITAAVEALNEGAQQVAAASEQLASSSEQLAEGSAEQAASIEETASTLEESSSMIKQNAENSRQAAILSRQAKEAADKGNGQMGDMMTSMEDLKKSSDEISKIIKVIDEIAFQTNILALNAAVEAARAGEAGMGFAVVAEEVRNLAQRSAQAAKDTAVMIESNIQQSQTGVELASKVNEALGEIDTQAQKVNELVDEISVAGQEQASGISEINKGIGQMEQVVQEIAAAAEESASASEELAAQAENMRLVVDQLFKVVEGGGASGEHQAGFSGVSNTRGKKLLGKKKTRVAESKKRSNKSVSGGLKSVDPEKIIPLEDDTDGF